jgi:hypothetical protein
VGWAINRAGRGSHRAAGPSAELDLQGVNEEPNGWRHRDTCCGLQHGKRLLQRTGAERQLCTRNSKRPLEESTRARLCWESEDGRSEAVATARLGWAQRAHVTR